jgi:hypothetical protein
MTIRLMRTSLAPPNAVLDAIRENTREWRESAVPPAMRELGVLQVISWISAPGFEILALRNRGRTDGDYLRVKGTVRTTASGGSLIEADCGWSNRRWISPVLFGVVGLGSVLFGSDGRVTLFCFLVATVTAIIGFLRGDALTRSNPLAAYLITRFEESIAAADRTVPHPP